MNSNFKTIKTSNQSMIENYRLMIASISPRPIAFVGTQDMKGNDNLAPFSFFNGFGANPPIIGFSPSLSGRTGEAKDTLVNIREKNEFTVSAVSFEMVNQMSLSSCEYPHNVDEFDKSGLTKNNSTLIAPSGVSESPIIFECKMIDIIELGGKPGSGNLILGEILVFHIKEHIINNDNIIDEEAIDLIGRMGYGNYTRSVNSMFSLNKPKCISIGFDALPDKIKNSEFFNGSQLAKLASVENIPSDLNKDLKSSDLYKKCVESLDDNKIDSAWQIVHQILKHE